MHKHWCVSGATTTYSEGDVYGLGVADGVQVPAALAHPVADLVRVHFRVLGRERDDRRGWVPEDVELWQLRLDPTRDVPRRAYDGPARFQVPAVVFIRYQ